MHCKPIDRYRMVLTAVKCKVQLYESMQLDKLTHSHSHLQMHTFERAPEFTNDGLKLKMEKIQSNGNVVIVPLSVRCRSHLSDDKMRHNPFLLHALSIMNFPAV